MKKRLVTCNRLVSCRCSPHLLAVYKGISSAGPQPRNETFRNVYLLSPAEQMKEAVGVDNGKPARQNIEALVIRIQQIANDKRGAKLVGITKEIIAKFNEAWLNVGAKELSTSHTVGAELPQGLAKAAAYIKNRVCRFG